MTLDHCHRCQTVHAFNRERQRAQDDGVTSYRMAMKVVFFASFSVKEEVAELNSYLQQPVTAAVERGNDGGVDIAAIQTLK